MHDRCSTRSIVMCLTTERNPIWQKKTSDSQLTKNCPFHSSGFCLLKLQFHLCRTENHGDLRRLPVDRVKSLRADCLSSIPSCYANLGSPEKNHGGRDSWLCDNFRCTAISSRRAKTTSVREENLWFPDATLYRDEIGLGRNIFKKRHSKDFSHSNLVNTTETLLILELWYFFFFKFKDNINRQKTLKLLAH